MAGALPAVPRPTGSAAPELVLLLSLPMLRHADVLRCGAAGRFWSAVSLGPAVWGALCDREWKGKVYIPAAIRRARELEPRRAFREALLDARRLWIRAEELVELQWWHRMKASAGEHFTQSDPWWRGAAAGPLSFRCREDHTTCWIDPDSQRPFGDGTWRFVPRCCGKEDGPWGRGVYDGGAEGAGGADEGPGRGPHVPRFGSYIRGRPRRGMRETPTKVVFRHPETWGFVLDSCWAVHTSWPLPRRGQDPSLEDSALPMTVENMHSEAQRYNRGQQIDPEDPDPVDDGFEVGLEYRGEDDSLGRLVRVRMGDQAFTLPYAMLRALARGHGPGEVGVSAEVPGSSEEEWEAEGAGGSAESELGGGTP